MKRVHSYSHKARMRDEDRQKWVEDKAESLVTVIFESETLEEYRKHRPHYARMLERGTALVRKCIVCGISYIIARYKNNGKCWACFSGDKPTFPRKIQKIIDKLWEEYYAYINQDVKITKLENEK